jgi:succinate-acetate transporter protein
MVTHPHAPDPKTPRVMGHVIPRARLTAAGFFWIFVYLVVPVIVLGNLIDFMFQYFLGWCIGVWCVFPS